MDQKAVAASIAALALLAPGGIARAAVHAQSAAFTVAITSPKKYPLFPQRFGFTANDLSQRKFYNDSTFVPYIYPSSFDSFGHFDNYKPYDVDISIATSFVLRPPNSPDNHFINTMHYEYRFDTDQDHVFNVFSTSEFNYSRATIADEDVSVQLVDLASGSNLLDYHLGYTKTSIGAGSYLLSVDYTLDISVAQNEFPVGAGLNMFSLRHVIDGSAIPEPATWGTMLVGLGFLGAAARRKRLAARAIS